VTFTALPLNGKPVVTAALTANNPPLAGETITLTGTATDRDNDPVTVRWTQTSGPAVTLVNPTSLVSTFVAPDASGLLTFQIVGNDGFDDSAAKSVSTMVNRKPTAVVSTSPSSGAAGTNVIMNGMGSSDPENDTLTYQWTQIAPAAPLVGDLTTPSIQFTAPSGTATFRLVVSDGHQSSAPFTASFSTSPPPTVNPTASQVDATYGAAYGANVTLSSGGSGGAGPLTYTWRVVSQSPSSPTMSTITLSSTTAANPTFSVPLPTSTSGPFGQSPQAMFGVIANDGVQSTQEAFVTVKFFSSLNNGTTSQSSSTVYGIVQTKCTQCHGGTGNTCTGSTAGSGLSSTYGMGTKAAFLSNSRNVNACASSKKRLPGAGNTGGSGTISYFWDRISGAASPVMPTSGSLTTTEKNMIQDWIDQGNNDN
jgi:hypothetical protein